MKLNSDGMTRIVLIFNSFVVKVPKLKYGWKCFLQGILANINEASTWQNHPRKDLLCPVLWSSWGGWVLIMQNAIPCEDGFKINYYKWIEAGLGGDDKPDNYGVFNSQLVKIDYAT